MKTPVGLVTAALTAAILLAASFLIATGTRGENVSFASSAGQLEVQTVASGLVNPWSLAFLPDGRMLVTERPGRMRVVTAEGQLSPPLKGVPEVWASNQGGLLDVIIDKSYPQNKTIYFCFAEGTGGGGRAGAKPEIWSYGHRNEQGLAINPASGDLWEIEHGPRGGDEVNIIGKGKNYGWPVIGYGIDYNGAKIHESTAKDGMEQPIKYWVPSIAPSGMTFYTAALFPKWTGSLFTGALAGRMLVRLSLNGNTVTGEERLLPNLNERIRDVRQGPDGALWLLTDNSAGRILRVSPAAK